MSKLPSPWAVASTTPAPVTGGVITVTGGSGMSNPMTAQYQVIIGGTAGTPTALSAGANGTFLGVSGGVLGYYTPSGSGISLASGSSLSTTGNSSVTTFAFPASNTQTYTFPPVTSSLPFFTAGVPNTNMIPFSAGTSGALSFMAAATNGVLITSATQVPSILAGAAGVLVGSASAPPTWSTYLPAAQMPALTGDVTNTAGTVATTVGGIKGTSVPTLAAGYLYYNGSAFSWATPAAASWPVSGTPAIVSALGSLANAAGFLENNGSGTLSWVNPSGMTNPFTLIGQLLVCSAGGSPGTPAALPTATGTLSCSGTTVSWANIVLTPTGGSPATVTLASGMTFAVTGTNATATLAFPASNTTTITMPTVTSTLAFWSGSAPNSNQVAYSIGTTGALGFVTAATYGVLISGSTGTPVMLAGAAGVLVGSASTPPAWSLAPSGLTSINNVALTAPASLATLTFASGSTMTTTGAYAWTLAVPGAYTYTLPSATSTLAGLGNANTWSAAQTLSVPPVLTQGATFSSYAGGTTAGQEWYDSTQLCPAYYSNGMKRFATQTCFVQTANGATSGTSAITMFGTGVGTKTFGTSWVAGQTVRIRMEGVLTTAATPGTSTITLMLTGTTNYTIATTAATTLTASMSAVHWELDYTMTARSSTSVMGSGMLRIYPTASTVLLVPFTTTTATTITAIALTADVQSLNSVSAGAVFTSYNATVEVLA